MARRHAGNSKMPLIFKKARVFHANSWPIVCRGEIHKKNKRCSFFLALWLATENVKENSHVENLTFIPINILFVLLIFSQCPHSKFPKHKADPVPYLKFLNGSPCVFYLLIRFSSFHHISKCGFLNISTFGILDGIILCCEGLQDVYSIPDLYQGCPSNQL